MLVLLPPSEGKSPGGGRRRRLDLTTLSWPELTPAREQVLDALAEVSARPDALALLGVGLSLSLEVARNTRLREVPALPVSELYTGVLYDALDLPGLPARARSRAARQVVVVSALWGALRPGDRVPPYRLSMDTDLPGLGPLAAFWRPRLGPALTAAAGRGLIVDCRSSTYQAPWQPPRELAARTVAVRVLREQAGRRSVVSHQAKLTRGQVVSHLLLAEGTQPHSPAALARLVSAAFECELVAPAAPGRCWTLDIVVRDP